MYFILGDSDSSVVALNSSPKNKIHTQTIRINLYSELNSHYGSKTAIYSFAYSLYYDTNISEDCKASDRILVGVSIFWVVVFINIYPQARK